MASTFRGIRSGGRPNPGELRGFGFVCRLQAALTVYPARFEYAAASDLEEAIELLERLAEANPKILAGGQSLIPLMKLRLATPSHLIDLRRVPGLTDLAEDGSWLRIGAMTTEAVVEGSELLSRRYPILVDASSRIADPLVRNLATVGGNLAHGDPANDHPAVMVALEAQLVVRGSEGERIVDADSFFRDVFVTHLGEAEILTEIRVPVALPRVGASYLKLERQAGDYAIAGAAVRLQLEGELVSRARIAFTNLGPIAARGRGGEEMLEGAVPDDRALRQAAEAATAELEPWTDLRGSADYKRRVATVLTYRALRSALRRAGGSGPPGAAPDAASG